ncbi:MAG: outer rane adhesin like protein [Caulobacter sp.]|nr:outer rane adhesin like protein [Caulobacter sp.]
MSQPYVPKRDPNAIKTALIQSRGSTTLSPAIQSRLAQLSYFTPDQLVGQNGILAGTGWTVVGMRDVRSSGFFAIALKNEAGELVFSYRGSQPTDLIDWFPNNAQMLFGLRAAQQADAVDFTASVFNAQGGSAAHTWFFGHSLGAGLAELSAFYTYKTFGITNFSGLGIGSAPFGQSNLNTLSGYYGLQITEGDTSFFRSHFLHQLRSGDIVPSLGSVNLQDLDFLGQVALVPNLYGQDGLPLGGALQHNDEWYARYNELPAGTTAVNVNPDGTLSAVAGVTRPSDVFSPYTGPLVASIMQHLPPGFAILQVYTIDGQAGAFFSATNANGVYYSGNVQQLNGSDVLVSSYATQSTFLDGVETKQSRAEWLLDFDTENNNVSLEDPSRRSVLATEEVFKNGVLIRRISNYTWQNMHYERFERFDEVSGVRIFAKDDVTLAGIVNVGSVGNTLGSALGRALSDDPLGQQIGSVLFGTLGENIFEGAALTLSPQYSLEAGMALAFDDFGYNFSINVAGAISSILIAELIDALGLEGTVVGELGSTALSQVINQIINNLATGAGAFTNISVDPWVIVATYVGTELGRAIWSPDTVAGQIGAELGASIGSVVGVALAVQLGLYGGEAGFTIWGPIGALIGAVVGYLVGALIGSFFGEDARSSATVTWNAADGNYVVTKINSDGGAPEYVAQMMANQVSASLNGLLDTLGGTLIDPAGVRTGSYGQFKSSFVYRDVVLPSLKSNDIDVIVRHGTFVAVRDLVMRIAGGDIYLKRAAAAHLRLTSSLTAPANVLADSEGFDLKAMYADLQIGIDYATYRADPTVINALMAENPDSTFTAGWLVTIARAFELGLNRRAITDWTGGYATFLDEMYDGGIEGQAFSPASLLMSLGASDERLFQFFDSDGDLLGTIEDTINDGDKEHINGTSGANTLTITGEMLASASGVTVDGVAMGSNPHAIRVAAVISTGDGADTVRAGDRGNDVLGGAGNDMLVGGKLDDWLFGGDGNDVLFAGNASNITFSQSDGTAEAAAVAADGGNGNLLDGDDGDDRIYGGQGSDWLRGGDGVDHLVGGAGGDVIEGGVGNDAGPGGEARLLGGAGADQYIFGYGDGQDVILDQDASVATTVGDISSQINTIKTQAAAGYDVRNWSGHGAYLIDGSIVGGEDAIAFGTGVTLEDVTIKRSGTTQSPGNDLIILLTRKNSSGVDVPTGDQLTIKNWFVTANRIEYMRFANGDEFRIADITTFIVGTGGSDVIIGTSGTDFVYGGAGNDVIHALQGKDFISGGLGNDMVTGDSDEDLVLGGLGNDMAGGGGGNDTVLGDQGDDTVYGGAGSDIVSGGRGNDTVHGGAGDDIVLFKRGDGRDTLIDELVNNWEQIAYTNGQGQVVYTNGYVLNTNGTVTKGGVVYFDGEKWLGTYDYDDSTGYTRRHLGAVSGAIAVNSGTDTLEFGESIDIQDLQFQRDGNDLILAVSDVDSTASFASVDDQIRIKDWFGTAGRSIENFVFAATGVISTVTDTPLVEGYSTIWAGTNGDDVLTAGDNPYWMNGGAGDWMTGGAGNDTLTGGAGRDLLNGGDGNDILRGGGGANDDRDILYGGAGDDILDGGPQGMNSLFGGSGLDVASYQSFTTGVAVFLGEGFNWAIPTTSSLIISGMNELHSIEGLEGSEQADFLYGGVGGDLLRGMGGADMLKGGGGDDTYEFARGSGADTIQEGIYVKEIMRLHDYSALGGPVNNYTATWGLAAQDPGNVYRYEVKITENATGDVIYLAYKDYPRTSGNANLPMPNGIVGNIFYPAPEYFTPTSGGFVTGEEVYAPFFSVFPSFDQYERIKMSTGEGGSDTIRMGADIGLSDLTFSKSGNNLVIGIVGTTDSITLKDQFTAGGAVNTDRAVETLTLRDGLIIDLATYLAVGGSATSGKDLVVGGSGADTLTGLAGNDVLSGAGGADDLSGGDGDDILEGGAGGDQFNGGSDRETLGLAVDGSNPYGDTIRYVRSGSAVTIDLAARTASGGDAQGDTITGDGSGVSTIENLTGSEGYGDLLKGDSRGNRLVGLGGADTLYGRAGDDVLAGGAGVDNLYGEDGDDNIVGGLGNDLAWGGAGKDALIGQEGDDTLRGEDGDDLLTADVGADTLYGGAGDDMMYGEDGNDILDGGTGHDKISGGAGVDALTGGDGDDNLSGGAGADSLSGGLGSDTYSFDASSDADTLVDADGANRIEISGATSSQIWMTRSGDNLKIGVIGGSTLITVTNFFAASGRTLVKEIALQSEVLFLDSATALITQMTTASASVPTTMPQTILDVLPGHWHGGASAAPEVADQEFTVSWNNVLTGSVGAQDDDGDIPTTDAYSMTGQPLHGVLTLNADTGAWTYAPDDGTALEDSFFITVTDAAGHHVEQMVTVNVTAPPPAPTVTASGAQVRNDTATLTSLQTIDNLTANQTGGTATFEIVDDPWGWFSISGSQVKLNAGLNLNFETLAALAPGAHWSYVDQDADGLAEIRYVAHVRSVVNGVASDVSTVSFRVEDVNESPVMVVQTVPALAENAAMGSLVTTFTATDPDTHANTRDHRFTLGGTDAAAFTIDTMTGDLRVNSAINYEAKTSYSIIVYVTDRGGAGLTAQRTYSISVTNLNEAPIVAAQAFSLDENSSVNTVVGTVVSSDPDTTNATFRNPRYSLGAGSTGFAINATTGQITLTGTVNYEAQQVYSFTVRVTDTGGTGLWTENTITVNINDLNEAGPTSAPTFSMVSGLQSEIGTSVQTTVANLTATQTGGTPVLAIASDPLAWFEIVGSALKLKAGLNLDFETLAAASGQGTTWTLADSDSDGLMEITYQVTVRSSVGGTNSDASGAITYRIEDVNESPTVSAASFSLAENPTAGTVLGSISWSDPDSQSSTRDPRFALSGTDAALFAIDAATGQLTVTGVLDYETKNVYTVTVTATDRAGTGLSGSNTVTVTVSDANDAPIVAAQTFSVNEKVANNTAVGTIVWSDPDAISANRNPRFAISGADAAMFNINTTTGALTAKAGLDYETKSAYSFTVTVTDQGGTGLATSQTVIVNLGDVNDAPTLPSQSFSIAENSALNAVIGTANVTDQDGLTANRNFRFSLTGTDAAAFAIDNLTGQLTLQTAVNYEVKSSYSINLVVTDQGGSGLTATRAVTVSVADVNEPITVSAQSFSVDENVSASTVVGTVAWSDPDTATTNRNPRFAITGADASAFRIGSTTGIITTFNALNFEVKSTYTFTVTVTDKSGTGFAASETITISINDLYEGSMIVEPKGNGSTQGSPSSSNAVGVRSSLVEAGFAPARGGGGRSMSLATGALKDPAPTGTALDLVSTPAFVAFDTVRELSTQTIEITDNSVGRRGGEASVDALSATADTDAAQTPSTLPLAPKGAVEDDPIALPAAVPADPLAGAAQNSGITVTSASGGVDLGDARPGAVNRTATPDTSAQVMRDAMNRPMADLGDQPASGRAAQQPWMQAAVQAMGLWKPEWSAPGGQDTDGANPEIDFDIAAAGDARSALDQRLDLQQRNRIKMVNAMAGFAPEGAASLDGGNEKLHDPRAMALLTSLPQHRTGVGL